MILAVDVLKELHSLGVGGGGGYLGPMHPLVIGVNYWIQLLNLQMPGAFSIIHVLPCTEIMLAVKMDNDIHKIKIHFQVL